MIAINDKQRVIAATFVCTLFVATVFFVPWQRNDTEDIRWAPFYQNPITYESTFDGDATTNRFAAMKGQRMYGLYLFQIAALAGLGFVLFYRARDT